MRRASQKAKFANVFGQSRRPAEMLRAPLYARVSTNDQPTLAMQNRAKREYAARRGWAIAPQVREVNSGAARRGGKPAKRYSKPPAAGKSMCYWYGD